MPRTPRDIGDLTYATTTTSYYMPPTEGMISGRSGATGVEGCSGMIDEAHVVDYSTAPAVPAHNHTHMPEQRARDIFRRAFSASQTYDDRQPIVSPGYSSMPAGSYTPDEWIRPAASVPVDEEEVTPRYTIEDLQMFVKRVSSPNALNIKRKWDNTYFRITKTSLFRMWQTLHPFERRAEIETRATGTMRALLTVNSLRERQVLIRETHLGTLEGYIDFMTELLDDLRRLEADYREIIRLDGERARVEVRVEDTPVEWEDGEEREDMYDEDERRDRMNIELDELSRKYEQDPNI